MSARAAAERGFVLIGVVVMVLALTIIGISLYSLSGYEVQFFGRSYDERRATYAASGGVELVKMLVTSPIGNPATARLSSAGLAVGREGVTSAIAWQTNPNDTSGPVQSGKPVFIRVTATVNGQAYTAGGMFTPSGRRNPYQYLYTMSGLLRYADPGDPPAPAPWNARGDVVVRGNSWQNVPPSDTTWKTAPFVNVGTSFKTDASQAPLPASAQFITAHWAGATQVSMNISGGGPTQVNRIDFDAEDDPTFFRLRNTDPNGITDPLVLSSYDFVSGRNLRIRVAGTAVWLVPAGLYFNNGVTVERLSGGTTPNLVIVVGPNGRYPGATDIGPFFENGIEIANRTDVNVWVVTHGSIKDKEAGGASDHNVAESICFFGLNYTMLPGYRVNPANQMVRKYAPSMGPVADDLLSRGLLPQPIGGISTGLDLVPGTWTESR